MSFIEIYFCANIVSALVFIIYCFRKREPVLVAFIGMIIMLLFAGVIAAYGIFKKIWEALM